MSHPASDIPPRDPRKEWSFNEVGVCECMNSAGLPFELNLFIRASVISLWYRGNRRPSESWHLCHGWWSRQGGERPSACIPDHQFQIQCNRQALTGPGDDKRVREKKRTARVRCACSLSADSYTCSLLGGVKGGTHTSWFCKTHEQPQTQTQTNLRRISPTESRRSLRRTHSVKIT